MPPCTSPSATAANGVPLTSGRLHAAMRAAHSPAPQPLLTIVLQPACLHDALLMSLEMYASSGEMADGNLCGRLSTFFNPDMPAYLQALVRPLSKVEFMC